MNQNDKPRAQFLDLQNLPDGASGAARGEPIGAAGSLDDLPVSVEVRVGCARLTLAALSALRADDVLELDVLLTAPVDLMIEDKVVARGELVAVDEHFALRITEPPRASGAAR